MSERDQDSFLYGTNAVYIKEIYLRYIDNPSSVSEDWASFFAQQADEMSSIFQDVNGPSWQDRDLTILNAKQPDNDKKKLDKPTKNSVNSEQIFFLQAKQLVDSFREKGHNLAKLDPLCIEKTPNIDEIGLNLVNFGFDDPNQEVDLKNYVKNIERIKIGDLHQFLLEKYSTNFAVEFSHLRSEEEKKWLYEYIESDHSSDNLTKEQAEKILTSLIEVKSFEEFLHVRFKGAKRFSVEGSESAIIVIEQILDQLASKDANRVIFGMAHRGRLNILTKIMGKSYEAMFSEFAGSKSFPGEMPLQGDVKYHLGFSNENANTVAGNHLSLSMVPNPSHLETVNPVMAGKTKSEQDYRVNTQNIDEKTAKKNIASILLHGDAAFCGQGVVAESLAISEIPGYNIGGTIHLVINNQVGFTANPRDVRNSRYPTEFCKIIAAPIIHVNGYNIKAVIKAACLLAEFRQKFLKDIALNLVTTRLYGHNENDEPNFTQPLIYKKMVNLENIVTKFHQEMMSHSLINSDFFEEKQAQFKDYLNEQFEKSKEYKPHADWLQGNWKSCEQSNKDNFLNQPFTGVEQTKLHQILEKITHIPENFEINKKIARQLEAKRKIIDNGSNIDWATGEALAFGSLLQEEIAVRLSGQDAGRGTFSHRHSVWHDQNNSSRYLPLNHIDEKQAKYQVYDSPLSEYAVMGFEYGYALFHPNNLVLWEGQFGDFVNGAQIIIDQYITSAETKWLRQNGLVLLLPHAYEGQGPEHTSARFERFLQLCADDNISVAYPTTPASYFHLLRRQLARTYRKPLIIMTPKSLLRHRLAVSEISDFEVGTKFSPILGEVDKAVKEVKKVVLCSGKVYYDLYEYRNKNHITNVALIRLEQLYPFPKHEIMYELEQYKNSNLIWCQEEPQNMGAYWFIRNNLDIEIKYIGRPAASSPATGYMAVHNQEQQEIIKQVFEGV